MAQEMISKFEHDPSPSAEVRQVRDFYADAERTDDPNELFRKIMNLRFTEQAEDRIPTTQLLLLLQEQYPSDAQHSIDELKRLVVFVGMFDLPPEVAEEVLTPEEFSAFSERVAGIKAKTFWQRRLRRAAH